MQKKNYAFLICLCGTLIIMCTSGLTLNGFYPYIPFIEAQGYTGIQTSSLVTNLPRAVKP